MEVLLFFNGIAFAIFLIAGIAYSVMYKKIYSLLSTAKKDYLEQSQKLEELNKKVMAHDLHINAQHRR